jgi:glycosyltransferase involved in cell wall biosynthesis
VRAAGAVITPTHAVAAEVADTYRIGADRVVVTHLGVDSSWFETAPPTPPELPKEYILAVGTLEPRKGLDVLLTAYRALLANSPDRPPLVLVGPPGWGPALSTAGVPADRVIRPGYVDGPTLRGIVAGATVLAFPSRYEGFGLPPLEALAAGTPVVASDLPATREVLGGHARLVPPADADALAAALHSVIADPPTAEARHLAREHAATFGWRRCAEQTAAVYRDLAAG